MKGINKVSLGGYVGKDPDIKISNAGTPIANFSLATSDYYKDKETGEKKDRTEWHQIVAFGKRAEIIRDYVKKGSKILIDGSLNTQTYEKEGQKHYVTKIVVRDINLLGDSNGSGSHHEKTHQEPPPDMSDLDDDIPF